MPPLPETFMTNKNQTATALYKLSNSAEKNFVEIVFSDFHKLLVFFSLYRNFAALFAHVFYFFKVDM